MPTAKQPHYSSYIKDMPFLLLEMRKAANLIMNGETPDAVVSLSVEKNIFQLDKERRRLKLAQRVAARLDAVSPSVVALIACGQDENARLGVFYTILKTDLLFYEFMRDIYSDRIHIGQIIISDSDIATFLSCKTSESEKMSAWTTDNLVRVKNTYKKILTEAGLAKVTGTGLSLTKPIMNDELKAAWKSPDHYTAAMCMEV